MFLLDIEHDLVEKLKSVGEKLRASYEKTNTSNDNIRQMLTDSLTVFRQMQTLSTENLAELLKNKEIAEDEERRLNDATQKLTDKFIAEVDVLLAAKEKDLMAI